MQVVGGLLTGLAPVNPGDAAAMCAQQDVFVDRQVGNQTYFLRSDGDAVTLGIFRALKMYWYPVDKDLAFGGGEAATDEVHQV